MRPLAVLAVASLALAATLLLSLSIGAAHIGASDVLAALAHPSSPSIGARIVWEVRLPRVAIAALVGATLGLSGALLQSLLSNPLVDSSITGVSAGATVAVALAIVFGVALPYVPALGFVAGLLAGGIVIALSLGGGRIVPMRLLLAGVFVSALLSAVVEIVLFRMEPGGAANAIVAFIAGSLSGHGWDELRWSTPYALAGVALAAFSLPGLNVLRLGETRALSLGVDVTRTKLLVMAAASLLTAAAVTLAGQVAFVGLLAAHLARRAIGSDVRFAAPMAGVVGAVIVTVADAAARTWAQPGELPVGALISILGVPAFFYLFARETRPAARPARAFSLQGLRLALARGKRPG